MTKNYRNSQKRFSCYSSRHPRSVSFFSAQAFRTLLLAALFLSSFGAFAQELVKDISPGAIPSVPNHFININGTLFFAANDGTNGLELWKSDGTAAGTVMVKDIRTGALLGSDPNNLVNLNGTLYFQATNGTNLGQNGYELWKSDGTAAGTVMVKDIFPGASPSAVTIANLANINGTLFFTTNDGTHGNELWKSDGTDAGTVMVKDITPGPGASNPSFLTNINGTVFFRATDGVNGLELWKSDGTDAGTVMVKDIYSNSNSSSPGDLINVNGTLFFAATIGGALSPGRELWKSDGTTAGTVIVKDIFGGTGQSFPSNFININGTLFFRATNGSGAGQKGYELWKSDGTDAGTVMVKDINPGTGNSNPDSLTNINGTLFFTADNGTNGRELWKSDGTDAGTVLVKDINLGSGSSSSNNLVNVNDTLYFSADDGINGRELWKSDGTTAGTVMMKDINPGSGSSSPALFTNVNGTLFFKADDGTNGLELWRYLLPIQWTGANSTDWNNTTNWNGNVVPTAVHNVTIPDVSSGSGNFPNINTAAATNNIAINANATLTIPGGQSLSVNGLLTNNGTVTVQSGGSLVQATGSTLAGSGTYNVQRAVPANVKFIGSPINNETVNGFGIIPTGNNGGQVMPSPSNPCNPDSVAYNSPYGNLMEIRENATVLNNCAQSLWHVKSSGTLTNGRGYSLSSPATTLDFSGTVNNDTVTYAGLTRQSGTILDSDGSNPTMGWHLVSNPYPSPITLLGSNLTALGFDGQIQRYNAGSWVSNDPLLPVTIAVGQGFQIRKTNVGGTANFTLTNALRTAANPTFYKTDPREHYLNITLANNTYSDSTMVYFMDDATDNFDADYDANRFVDESNKPMLYTFADNERLSYNALQTMNAGETKTVSLSARTGIAESYTLTFHDVATLNATVFLEDLKLNTTQPVNEGFVYNFTTATGDSRERFLLHFNANSVSGITQLNDGLVRLYPNPTNGTVALELNANIGFNEATVTNLSGITVQSHKLNSNKTQLLNTSELPAGIYFITLSGASTQTLKLIKQ
jgi:ELWxxDGT repeat protein